MTNRKARDSDIENWHLRSIGYIEMDLSKSDSIVRLIRYWNAEAVTGALHNMHLSEHVGRLPGQLMTLNSTISAFHFEIQYSQVIFRGAAESNQLAKFMVVINYNII